MSMHPAAVAVVTSLCLVAQAAAQNLTLDESSQRLPPPPIEAEAASDAPASPSDRPPAHSASEAHDQQEEIVFEEPGWHVWEPAFWDPWEGGVELGLSGTEGNSQTFNVRFGLKAKHKTDEFVRSLEITSIQKSAGGVTTANTALLDGRLEWPMPESKWNYYVHGLAERDEFKAFDYRLSADTGLGYEFIQNDVTTLLARAGVSASQELGGPDDEVKPELALGSEFKHKFNATHSISGKVDYFPNVSEFSDFRLNSQASWEIALSSAWGLSLKLSVIDRYDSTPQGARPNDLDYSTLLLWQF
jgi:putative salt-induced outer membrane protein YdiY